METIMPTVLCKLKSKTKMYPSGLIPIECSDVDVEWIEPLTLSLGENSHPCIVNHDIYSGSLARLVLWKNGVPLEQDEVVYRKDTAKPLNVSHDNLCVPTYLLGNKWWAGVRDVAFSDWSQITRPIFLSPEYYSTTCVFEDGTDCVLQIDSEDTWLEGRVVRFTPKGNLLIKVWNEQLKEQWIPLSNELARRHYRGNLNGAIVRRLPTDDFYDVRKRHILIVDACNRAWIGVISPPHHNLLPTT